MKENGTVQSFTDLRVWQDGHRFVLDVYSITKKFPLEERFALADQLRRAVVSITSNIAEGFSRNSKKEKLQFYSTALGSLTETQNQLIVFRDLHYIDSETFDVLAAKTVDIHKMLNGLIKHAQGRTP